MKKLAIPILFSLLLIASPVMAFDENYGYYKNITESTGNPYTSRFSYATVDTSALISASKMNSDCSDLRVACNDVEVDRKVIGCGQTDTLIWWNYTSTDNCSVYYGYSGASSPSDYNYTHWTKSGYDFDQLATGYDILGEDEWSGSLLTATVNTSQYVSGSSSGNKSLYIEDTATGTAGSLYYTFGPVAIGKIKFGMYYIGGASDSYIMQLRDDGTDEVTLINIDSATDEMVYYNGSGNTLATLTPGEWYEFEIDWNTNTFYFNISVSNSTWSYASYNNDFHDGANVGDVTVWYMDTGQAKYLHLDDIIVWETTELDNPVFSLGSEMTPPTTTTTTVPQVPFVSNSAIPGLIIGAGILLGLLSLIAIPPTNTKEFVERIVGILIVVAVLVAVAGSW